METRKDASGNWERNGLEQGERRLACSRHSDSGERREEK